MSDDPARIVCRNYDEVFGSRNRQALDELIAPDFTVSFLVGGGLYAPLGWSCQRASDRAEVGRRVDHRVTSRDQVFGRLTRFSESFVPVTPLPDGSGVEVCREVRSSMPEVHCLMLTSYADDEALFDAIMAGASGYVLKEIRGNDLVDAIRQVASGKSLLDPMATQRVLERLRNGERHDSRLDALSEQEKRILELIGEGMTNRQIGEQMHLAEKTVKNYVSSLLAKLGMAHRTQAAVYAARLAERRTRRPEV